MGKNARRIGVFAEALGVKSILSLLALGRRRSEPLTSSGNVDMVAVTDMVACYFYDITTLHYNNPTSRSADLFWASWRI